MSSVVPSLVQWLVAHFVGTVATHPLFVYKCRVLIWSQLDQEPRKILRAHLFFDSFIFPPLFFFLQPTNVVASLKSMDWPFSIASFRCILSAGSWLL